MTIGSATSYSPSVMASLIQAMEEEAMETPEETRLEAMQGDSQAQRLLEYRTDAQSAPSSAPARQPPPPGSFLNVKA